ncbi:arrestin domain-containing protein 3-like isoform X2 [Scleropages formosus]|uniref:arrestin domain-containing protein 3-like isoform X2 n=1 Tax=Scleropages formosus TaxID=113540 RepID=UPI0008790F3D|nr:arrestin domain-containing protein 3-like isoform X2 [Scleropages formosus]
MIAPAEQSILEKTCAGMFWWPCPVYKWRLICSARVKGQRVGAMPRMFRCRFGSSSACVRFVVFSLCLSGFPPTAQRRPSPRKGSEALLSGDTFNNVMSPGTRVYPFSLQIPEGNFPSSFKGVHGYITYTLEAKLSRSMRIPSGAKAEFTIYSKPSMNTNQLMEPLFGAVQKKMKFFTSGTVSMNVTVDKAGYVQGEKLNISAEVENNSSRTLKPKFSLDQKQSFFAQRSSEIVRKSIFKEIGEPIPPSAQKIVQKELIIPPDLPASILNCSLLKVEYILKVYLDVPYARDPEVEFPLVILPNTYAFGPVTASNVAIGFEPFQGWHSQLSHVAPGLGQPQNTPAAQPPGAAFGFYPPPQ